MLASQRSSLIRRGLALTEQFHPALITFEGHPPIACSRRTAATERVASALAGFDATEPQTFLIAADRVPSGIVLAEPLLFTSDGRQWQIENVTRQPGEPHFRVTANLVAR